MKVVVDTNVLVSGFFFGGVFGRILMEWSAGRITFVVSAPVLAEYREVGEELNSRYGPAAAAGCQIIVSGDRHLLEASGWGGIEVLKPRQFLESHGRGKK